MKYGVVATAFLARARRDEIRRLTLVAQRHSPPQLVEAVLEELDLVFLSCVPTATRLPSGASSHAASCGARSQLGLTRCMLYLLILIEVIYLESSIIPFTPTI